MVIDVGTGSGRAIARRVAREPRTLFVGVDADASALSEVSRRAARSTARGGMPNTLFLAASAEEMPGPLAGMADSITIVLPWGSLLRAVLEPDRAEFARVAAAAQPRAEIEILISSTVRDAASEGLVFDEPFAVRLAQRYGAAGFRVEQCRPASAADVHRLSSGWGQRLGIPERRQAWIYRLRLSCAGDQHSAGEWHADDQHRAQRPERTVS